ncbi:protein 4.1 isoform X2 [Phycodurus eques]|uniref:protein 4.1 isoform X2 n=1 Tax=Phycodurus eques TaxID=693459 RepID=UPI002ACDDFD0|nr:protein 4.1 isoform X2 [Phycodurus eques]
MTTDEAESHQKKPRQQEEAGQDAKPSSPDKELLRPRNRNSAGRGLSRLFSSFLKRRSQCESEGGEKEEEEEAKAPIADPEPELKIEGEVAHDQHSVSSAEAQAARVEKKEAEEGEEEEEEEGGKDKEVNKEKAEVATLENKEDNKEEEEKEKGKDEGKEGGSEVSSNGEKEKKVTEEESKTPKAPRRPKPMQIKVTLLDDTLYECELDKHAKGQELFTKVCDHLNLLERDYYGLVIWETPNVKTWMDLAKEIRRQVQGANYDFTFNVKFYPPDPAQFSEDITRYYLCLQLRKDILQGRLPCSFVTLALLGSYALQSELGEYDPEVHGSEYAKEMKMANGQTKELEEKMMELHHTYRSMSPAQADMMFLENAKKLSMYGVDLHQAKDLDGVDIMLGVCSNGLMVYKDKLRINRFPWPKVLKVSYKRSNFFIKIRPSEVEQYESAIGFKLPNYKAAKKLWKVCVEHHTFFRLTSTEMVTTPRKFLALGSKFRYSGRTQAQTKQASSLIDRPAPLFQRTSSKRNSRSMDAAMASTPDNKSSRPVSAPIMSPLSPGENTPSPLLRTLHFVNRSNSPTPKFHRSADRKAEIKGRSRKTDSTKSQSPRPESTPEMKTLARRERRRSPSVTTANGEREKKNQHSPQDKTKTEMMRVRKKRAKKLEGETIYIRHSNLMLEVCMGFTSVLNVVFTFLRPLHISVESFFLFFDSSVFLYSLYFFQLDPKGLACTIFLSDSDDVDKTQTEIMRHHTSISELKRSFMESVPEPRPSEWDKRLSTNSPFRTAGINGQLQPASPVLKTQTITISDITNSLRGTVAYKDIPLVHTETKTITYESAQPVDTLAERDSGVLLSAQTITSETISTTTTTQITKTVKGGISETRIEKRIVITGDTEIDHDKALAQAIKEAKEQHPDMSVTKVVVHQETEISPE